MSGTRAGGLKAAATNKARHGDDFYINLGRKGGSVVSPNKLKGFAANSALAQIAAYKALIARKQRQAKGIEKVIRDGKEVTKILVYKTAGRPKKVRIDYDNNKH